LGPLYRNKQALLVTGTIHALLFIGIVVSVALTIRMLNERDRANSAEFLARNRLTEVQKERDKTRSALKEATRERDRAVAAERQEPNADWKLRARKTRPSGNGANRKS